MEEKKSYKGCVMSVLVLVVGIIMIYDFVSGGVSLFKHLITNPSPSDLLTMTVIAVIVAFIYSKK